MSFSGSPILTHLEKLVNFDTQNPPRNITSNSAIFNYLERHLSGFDKSYIDAGDGCLSLLATRGRSERLFNFHIDTVPISSGWKSDPHQLICQQDKIIGLGTCDIKGATACMLSAVNQTDGDVALLFSSDEEHGSSQAIKKFLSTNHHFKQAVVAEPTKGKMVAAHRGIQTATAKFKGLSGHASEARALQDNAIHRAGKWINAATNWVKIQSTQIEGLTGLPFNIGTINGGVKANMIASNCELKFGFRPLPGQNSGEIIEQLLRLTSDTDILTIEPGFFGPCLPAANQNFDRAMDQAKELINNLGIKQGPAVNFWTEASLFSQAGLTSLVFGPGDIAQAHTANEWVDILQLKQVEAIYRDFLNR